VAGTPDDVIATDPSADVRSYATHIEALALKVQSLRTLRRYFRELRFHLQRQQVRITYWLAPDKRVILLTMFYKTQLSEVAEVERAIIAQKNCEVGHGHAEISTTGRSVMSKHLR
jgi:Phage derived protein Gp49-like (DUF891)